MAPAMTDLNISSANINLLRKAKPHGCSAAYLNDHDWPAMICTGIISRGWKKPLTQG